MSVAEISHVSLRPFAAQILTIIFSGSYTST